MNEQLIIRLPAGEHSAEPQPVSWLIWHFAEQAVVASGELDDISELNQLAEKAKQRSVKVYVSSAAVGFHTVAVPAKSRRHLEQLIPYALEDEVAEDIELLHFFWPENLPKHDAIPVFVVRKQQVESWLTQLAQAGIHSQALYPDVFLLPALENAWSMAVFRGAYGPEWVIRQNAWQGVVLEPELAQGMLSPDYQEPDTELTEIVAYGDVQWPQSPAPLRSSDPVLPLELAISATNVVNVLQGEFRLQQASSTNWRQWRFPAIAASVFLAVVLVNEWVSGSSIAREAQAVQQQYENLFRQTFPNETRIVNIRSQLDRHAQASGSGDAGQVIRMLGQLQPAFTAVPMELTMLQYDHNRGELRMQANGANFQAFERFTQIAREQSLVVEQGQLTSRAGQINGTLVVRSGT